MKTTRRLSEFRLFIPFVSKRNRYVPKGVYFTGKMKTAQAILRSTSLPVAVVAARVGFENYSYFSQVYKKVIGITPSAERGKHTDAE